jgi:hypothetical protein
MTLVPPLPDHAPELIPFAKTKLFPRLILIGFLVMLSIGFLFGLYHTARTIGSYWFSFSIRGRLIHETETNKMLESGHPAMRMHGALAAIAKPDEVVLTFRLAEAAFYGKRRYLSFLDERMAPVYQAKNIEDAWQALRHLNVTYIMVPPYALPEVYGTITQRLLASPSHVSLLYDFQGWRLFQVQPKNTPSPSLVPIVGEDFQYKPQDASNWHMTEDKFNDPKGFPRLDKTTGWLSIAPTQWSTADHAPRLRLFRDEVFYGAVAGIMRRTLPLTPASIQRFEARVWGKGLVRIYLDYGDDRRLSFGAWSRTLIWEGILNGSEQNIMSQFMVPAEFPALDPNGGASSTSRITIETLGESRFALQKWRVEQVSTHSALLSAPYEPSQSWLIARSRGASSFELPLGSVQFGAIKTPIDIQNGVHVTNFGSYSSDVYGPFHLSLPVASQLLRISGDFSGMGVVRASLLYGCLGQAEPHYTHIGEILLSAQSERKAIVAGIPCAMSWVMPMIRLYPSSFSLRPKGSNTALHLEKFSIEGGAATTAAQFQSQAIQTQYTWQPLPISHQTYFRFLKESEKPRFP